MMKKALALLLTTTFFSCSIAEALDVVLIGVGPESNESLELVDTLLAQNSHTVLTKTMLDNITDDIEAVLQKPIEEKTPVIIIIGGVGATSQDRTSQVVAEAIDKELPGYGEAVRQLIGLPESLDSTAEGGIANDSTMIFTLPADETITKLATEKVILPGIDYLNLKLQEAKAKNDTNGEEEDQTFLKTMNTVGPF